LTFSPIDLLFGRTVRVAWKAPGGLARKRGRLYELNRALRLLWAQYQRRAEVAASGRDRAIERIKELKAEKPKSD
jgi:hypothetical protein